MKYLRLLILFGKHGKAHNKKISMILDEMHVNGIGA